MATQEHRIDTITSRPQPVRVSPYRGTWAWLLQRVTAYGLLIFLPVHVLFNFYGPALSGSPLTFEAYSQRFFTYPVIYALNEFGLLFCALFHGLNGVRNVVYDVSTNQTIRYIVTIGLLIIGAIFLLDGSLTLWALIWMQP